VQLAQISLLLAETLKQTTMKKLIVCASALCLFTIAANAQVKKSTTPAANKGSFMIKGGVNLANISVTDNGRVSDANMLTSFHAGIGADLPLSEGLSLQPSLLFTGKGAKTEQGNSASRTYYLKSTSNPYYIELPVNLVGKIPLSEYTRIYIGAGPYAAMGIAGKNKVEGYLANVAVNSEKDIVYSDDNPFTRAEENGGYGKLKRFDYGINAVAGLDFNKFAIGANYGYGLAKINSVTNNTADDKGKHRVLSFSLAVKL
jgi:hypothetical protein